MDAVYTGSTIVWLEDESTTPKSIIVGAAAALRFRDAADELGLTSTELAGRADANGAAYLDRLATGSRGGAAQELPDSPVVVAASLFPLWSPMVMPTRAATGSVPWWQLILAVALVAIAAYLMIRAGARIYRGAVLNVGARVRLRDAWRATT